MYFHGKSIQKSAQNYNLIVICANFYNKNCQKNAFFVHETNRAQKNAPYLSLFNMLLARFACQMPSEALIAGTRASASSVQRL